ncbi:hypothetical protein [Vibrio crassostreae]|uniref:Uncharacterized protein n=1 Tax=Vibrio crassostreae TaxID=246167 RepID=A0ABM9QSA6_9VIBR|nr:hypothetical protein [Vibrio crassostreae]ROS70353.1 hypothetical protein EDB73_10128 [Vibrio crassostreae]TCL30785.1 hypothetical protein EDB52_1011073 [Vibrio crassostreae]TCN89795.1 hypothetical protein EDB65_101602 [Vibrio crassostreae]TCT53128.1 hypothetical protein EDB39_101193 [Vibrio crassostreae]TCT64006.1 hypothetical protein EDB40_101505 [Vibrio crassostreae]
MKKGFVIAISIGFVVFFLVGRELQWFGSSNSESFPKLPDSPQFVPSTDFDGEWLGRRINTTGNNMCERTTITGIIREGKATLRLTYNGTPLEGWVTESGGLRLYAKHRQWDYRFSATGSGKRFDGRWHLTNGPCKGTWFIEKLGDNLGVDE